MKVKTIGYFSIFVGIAVIVMWIMILMNKSVPEGRTELTFHLFSEFLMALICLISGILLLRKKPMGAKLNASGLGMVAYSVLNAAGYYGERNNFIMMTMFVVLFLLTSVAMLNHLIIKKTTNT